MRFEVFVKRLLSSGSVMLCSVLKSYVSGEDAVSFRVGHLISNTIKQNINKHKSSFLQLLM